MPKPSSLVPEGRWSTEEAQAVLGMVERSGLSVQRFAAREGLVAERLYRWQRKLRDVPTQFVEVAAPVRASFVEVVLTNGVVLRVPESSSIEFVGRLVAVLDRDGAC